jgi:hypothetical protein
MEDWLKEYVVTVKLQTDVKLEALRTKVLGRTDSF